MSLYWCHIHTGYPFTLSTCRSTLQAMSTTCAWFPATLSWTVTADDLQKCLRCCSWIHSDGDYSSRILFPTLFSCRHVSTIPCLNMKISSETVQSSCITVGCSFSGDTYMYWVEVATLCRNRATHASFNVSDEVHTYIISGTFHLTFQCQL